ncbi:MAG: ATP-binding protein [Bdellovibrionales bacterium]
MKIVLTGGPSAGKTTLVQIIEREFRDFVVTVPESASILFKGGMFRGASELDLIYQQRAIYYLQVELETLAQKKNPNKVIVCDRGSLDGMAYWPSTSNISFLESIGTTVSHECERYDWVLHLETSASHAYDISNPIRIESYDQAKIVDEKVKAAWSSHPNRVIIYNSQAFSRKVEQVLKIMHQILF